jgi:CHASE2 domain-containing sensor protein
VSDNNVEIFLLTFNKEEGEQKFSVSLWLGNDRGYLPTIDGKIANIPLDLGDLYREWQSIYQNLEYSRIKATIEQPQQPIKDNFWNYRASYQNIEEKLETAINKWLNDSHDRSWNKIRDEIIKRIQRAKEQHKEIVVTIRTEDDTLKQIPWHLWDVLDESQAEVVCSLGIWQPPQQIEPEKEYISETSIVNILAIEGGDEDIQTEAEKEIWQALEAKYRVKVTWLDRPQLKEFETLWEQKWDLLYFAGHSNTQTNANLGEKGRIYINEQQFVTVGNLKKTLARASANGLKLAIFNSCDGFGIAEDLSHLNIPIAQVVFMREQIPNNIASQFLNFFLTAFTSGKSLSSSVREARIKLKECSDSKKYLPGISLMPVISVNVNEPILRGDRFFQPKNIPNKKTQTIWQHYLNKSKYALISLGVTLAVTGIRSTGLLQELELLIFDRQLRSLPAEIADRNLLLVTIDEEDLRRYGYPIGDRVLGELIDKIQANDPAAIGLDIVRDRPVLENNLPTEKLNQHFQKNERLVSVCAFNNNSHQSISPPPAAPETQTGFVDLFKDESNDILRRLLLSRTPNPISTSAICNTSYSFSWQLAYRYLYRQNIPVNTTTAKDWQFGEAIATRLQSESGSYQNLDTTGNQILLNYRRTTNPDNNRLDLRQIAQQVTMREILMGDRSFNPNWIKNRVILIGVTATSIPDSHDTPFGKLRGLYVHAHAVSQLINAANGDRPFIWWLSPWQDRLWLGFWALAGTTIVLIVPRKFPATIVLTGAIVVLYYFCRSMLMQAGWIPLIPAAIALVGAASTTKIALIYQCYRHSDERSAPNYSPRFP